MDATTIRLRPLDQADAASVHHLIQTAFATQDASVDPPQSALRETPATLADQIVTTGGLAAERGSTLIASVLWQVQPDGLYLGRLAVAPHCRCQGLARLLIEASAAEARGRGMSCLRLSTRLALASNRALFAACGFVATAERAHPGFARPTYVEMERAV